MITLREHTSSSYAPRTYHNASQGVTLAYAVDHNTAGERLTQKAANGKIVFAGPKTPDIDAARLLYKMLRDNNCSTVNVAGNGIYTFAKHGYTQGTANAGIKQILQMVHEHWPIKLVVSGGQSGADIAGLYAAANLGIDCIGTWPKGFKMRFEGGVDVNMTPDQIMEMIESYA